MHGRTPTETDFLVVAPVPQFDRASGSLRFYHMLRMIARSCRVTLLGWVDPGDPEAQRYVKTLRKAGIVTRVVSRLDLLDDLSLLLGQVRLGVFFEFYTSAERALGAVRLQRPDLPVVVDSVDVHFLREQRGARYAVSPWRAALRAWITKRRELAVYRQADLVVTVTEEDRIQLLRELPQTRISTIPNVHELREGASPLACRRRNSLLFVGGFAHPPNVDAVLFFCREVLPRLRERLGEVEVTIVGSQPPREIAELKGQGVVIAGWVPDMMPYLDSHAVAIAPLRYGAGMKGKIGEALAAGLPVVTTTVGAEGMHLEDGQTAFIADTPEAFSEAVTRLCTTPELHRALSEAGRSHARRHWDIPVVETHLVGALESLRGLVPKPLTRVERAGARARIGYVRCGLARKMLRLRSVTSWYLARAGQRWD